MIGGCSPSLATVWAVVFWAQCFLWYVCMYVVRMSLCLHLLRGACAPNPATEPDTHNVKEGRDCTSLVLRLAGLRENAGDNFLDLDMLGLFRLSWDLLALFLRSCLRGGYWLHKNTGDSLLSVLFRSMFFSRAKNQEHL